MMDLETLRLEKSEAVEILGIHARHGNKEEVELYSRYVGWLFKEIEKFGFEVKDVETATAQVT